MKPAHFKIIILVLCITGIMQAQSTDKNSSTNNKSKNLVPTSLKQIAGNVGEKALLSTLTNQANIQQVGSFNTANINQSYGNNTGSNIATIEQNKSNNNASITQNGNGNNNTITQNGNGNSAKINVAGNNNTSNIVQTGNDNVALQNITVNDAYYYISQIGNNNELLKYDNGLSPKALIITQKGNGLHLIINGSSITK